MKDLGIQEITSSAYNPQSQGIFERYHQTLKSKLKKFCEDASKAWDKAIPFIVFAAREISTESLCFYPNSLIFGHQVIGALQFVRKNGQMMNVKPVCCNICVKFIDRLRTSWAFVNEQLKMLRVT